MNARHFVELISFHYYYYLKMFFFFRFFSLLLVRRTEKSDFFIHRINVKKWGKHNENEKVNEMSWFELKTRIVNVNEVHQHPWHCCSNTFLSPIGSYYFTFFFTRDCSCNSFIFEFFFVISIEMCNPRGRHFYVFAWLKTWIATNFKTMIVSMECWHTRKKGRKNYIINSFYFHSPVWHELLSRQKKRKWRKFEV